jgi:hypothetical protein
MSSRKDQVILLSWAAQDIYNRVATRPGRSRLALFKECSKHVATSVEATTVISESS